MYIYIYIYIYIYKYILIFIIVNSTCGLCTGPPSFMSTGINDVMQSALTK